MHVFNITSFNAQSVKDNDIITEARLSAHDD